MMNSCNVFTFVVTLAVGAQTLAGKPLPAKSHLPDTTAGRLAADFFEAFNSGDDDRMRKFESTHRATSALEKRPIDERIEQYHGLRVDWGDIRVDGIFDSQELELSLGAIAGATEQFLRFRFELEPDPPHKLLAVYIQGGGPKPRRVAAGAAPRLDAAMTKGTVNRIAEVLDESYVFPDVGTKMADALRANLDAGRYADFREAHALAGKLTRDLRDICHDKHLRVTAGSFPEANGSHDEEDDDWWAKSSWENYGFERVERLAGNVGYLKFNQFSPSEDAQQTAAAAMRFLAGCSALIFDVRDNGGGSPEMIVFLSSYLFDDPVHLNSFYDRQENKTTETWTRTDVPEPRFGPTKPVYVLTSDHTFSAAEEFTYNLKHLGRATIVGETTGGGAHPVVRQRINDSFAMTVPYARAINPITKTNWEGKGVVPHEKVSAGRALSVAHEAALTKMIENTDDKERTVDLERALRRVQAGAARKGTDTARHCG